MDKALEDRIAMAEMREKYGSLRRECNKREIEDCKLILRGINRAHGASRQLEGGLSIVLPPAEQNTPLNRLTPVPSPAVTIPVSNTLNVPQGQDLGDPHVDSGNAGIPVCPSPAVPNLLPNEDECKKFEIRTNSC